MKTSVLIAALLTAFSFSSVLAYPDGYPRIGDPSIVAQNGNDDFIHSGHMRLVANPDENEYLAIWLSGALRHIRAQRLDGTTLEPIGGIINVISTVDAAGDPLTHPDDAAFDLEQVQNIDAEWVPEQGQYLLSIHLVSRERNPDDDLPGKKREIRAGYLNTNTLNVQPEQLVDLGDCRTPDDSRVSSNSSGLRVVHVPADDNTYVFWNFGTITGPDAPVYSGVCARRIYGQDTNGRPAVNGENKVVLELDDKTSNGYTAFSMQQLAVEHDPAHGQFIVASVVGEFLSGFEGSFGSVESHAVVGLIQEGLSHADGESSTTFNVFSRLGERHSVEVANNQQAVSAHIWPVNAPGLAKTSSDPGSTLWLLHFNAIHDSGESPPRDVFIRRTTVSEARIQLTGAQATRIGNNLETSTRPRRRTEGTWHEASGRYIFPWSADSQTQAHVYAKMIDDNGLVRSGGFRLTANRVDSTHGATFRFMSHVSRSLDGDRLFLVSEARDSIVIQPLEFHWDDLSVTVDAPGGNVNLSYDDVLELEVTVRRDVDDAVTNAIGAFDGDDFDIALSILEGLLLEPGGDTTVDPDHGPRIPGEPLAEGESRIYNFAVRNASEATEPYFGKILLELERRGDNVESDEANNIDRITVIPLPNPNPDEDPEEDPDDGEPGDGSGGGDGGGGGDDNDDDHDGNDSGDDNTGGDGSGTGDGTSGNDASGSGGGGGSTSLLLLAGMGVIGWQRRRLTKANA